MSYRTLVLNLCALLLLIVTSSTAFADAGYWITLQGQIDLSAFEGTESPIPFNTNDAEIRLEVYHEYENFPEHRETLEMDENGFFQVTVSGRTNRLLTTYNSTHYVYSIRLLLDYRIRDKFDGNWHVYRDFVDDDDDRKELYLIGFVPKTQVNTINHNETINLTSIRCGFHNLTIPPTEECVDSTITAPPVPLPAGYSFNSSGFTGPEPVTTLTFSETPHPFKQGMKIEFNSTGTSQTGSGTFQPPTTNCSKGVVLPENVNVLKLIGGRPGGRYVANICPILTSGAVKTNPSYERAPVTEKIPDSQVLAFHMNEAGSYTVDFDSDLYWDYIGQNRREFWFKRSVNGGPVNDWTYMDKDNKVYDSVGASQNTSNDVLLENYGTEYPRVRHTYDYPYAIDTGFDSTISGISNFGEVEAAAIQADSVMKASVPTNGSYCTNCQGFNEKWFLRGNLEWSFILPSGEIYDAVNVPGVGWEYTLAYLTDNYSSTSNTNGHYNWYDNPGVLVGAAEKHLDYHLAFFAHSANYDINWAGQQEKWFKANANGGFRYYYMLPNGDLYRWQSGTTDLSESAGNVKLEVGAGAHVYNQIETLLINAYENS